jgi:hypothetical protein
MVWSEPMSILAKRFIVSDVNLARVRRLLRIPLPGWGLLGEEKRWKADEKVSAVAGDTRAKGATTAKLISELRVPTETA